MPGQSTSQQPSIPTAVPKATQTRKTSRIPVRVSNLANRPSNPRRVNDNVAIRQTTRLSSIQNRRPEGHGPYRTLTRPEFRSILDDISENKRKLAPRGPPPLKISVYPGLYSPGSRREPVKPRVENRKTSRELARRSVSDEEYLSRRFCALPRPAADPNVPETSPRQTKALWSEVRRANGEWWIAKTADYDLLTSLNDRGSLQDSDVDEEEAGEVDGELSPPIEPNVRSTDWSDAEEGPSEDYVVDSDEEEAEDLPHEISPSVRRYMKATDRSARIENLGGDVDDESNEDEQLSVILLSSKPSRQATGTSALREGLPEKTADGTAEEEQYSKERSSPIKPFLLANKASEIRQWLNEGSEVNKDEEAEEPAEEPSVPIKQDLTVNDMPALEKGLVQVSTADQEEVKESAEEPSLPVGENLKKSMTSVPRKGVIEGSIGDFHGREEVTQEIRPPFKDCLDTRATSTAKDAFINDTAAEIQESEQSTQEILRSINLLLGTPARADEREGFNEGLETRANTDIQKAENSSHEPLPPLPLSPELPNKLTTAPKPILTTKSPLTTNTNTLNRNSTTKSPTNQNPSPPSPHTSNPNTSPPKPTLAADPTADIAETNEHKVGGCMDEIVFFSSRW